MRRFDPLAVTNLTFILVVSFPLADSQTRTAALAPEIPSGKTSTPTGETRDPRRGRRQPPTGGDRLSHRGSRKGSRPDGLDFLEGDIDPLLPVGVAGRMPRLDRLVVSPEGVSPSREASAMRGAIAAASVSSTLTSMFVVFVAIIRFLSSSRLRRPPCRRSPASKTARSAAARPSASPDLRPPPR